MATHSSVLAWRIPGTGEPGRLPSMGSHRVGHDWSDLAVAVAWLDEGFLGSSAGKESTFSSRDPVSIPGLRRSPGEGIGHPLQYSWASLVTQTVNNPPAVWETWVWLLGWEGPLEEGMTTHSSILAWRIPMNRMPGGLQSMGLQRIWVTKHSTWLDKLDDTNTGCHFIWRVTE